MLWLDIKELMMEVLPTLAFPIKITFDVFFDSSSSCEAAIGPEFFGLSRVVEDTGHR